MFDLNNNIIVYNNFYEHVNSNWMSKTQIPEDSMLINSFHILQENNLTKIQKMINKYKSSKIINNEYNKVITLYNQSFNLIKAFDLIKENKKIILEYIKMIMDTHNIEELRRVIIDMFILNGISSPNVFYIYNDYNNSNINILHIDTSGLGLPDRDYYTIEKKDINDEYKIFIQKYLDYFGLKWNASDIYNIEKILAEDTYTNIMKRDTSLLNNIYTLDEIKATIPYLYEDLIYFFKQININVNNLHPINIVNPKFTTNFYKLLYTCDFNIIKQYYVYLFLRKMGNYIDINTCTILFNFYGKTLSGIKEIQKPWKRSIDTLDKYVGMLVGKMFVNEYFNEKSKEKVIKMIKFIKMEFKKRLEMNTWMTSVTKKNALHKLDKMNFKVGYPDKWIDYSSLEILDTNTFIQNILNCCKFDFNTDINFLYKNIDRKKWFMNPHEINAYYSPSYNEIVFPCGILQEPFFSYDMDIACSFGGIGCIIGHEITHGFDDMGSKYDSDGNLKDWWTPRDIICYKEKTLVLKQQFDRLEINGNKVNGELTLGENIADLGGVEISFNSLKNYYKNHPSEYKNEFLLYKNFFYNYANIWKCVITKEESIKRLITDPHAPPCYRVNIILGNVNSFYDYFDILDTSPMWIDSKDRSSIW